MSSIWIVFTEQYECGSLHCTNIHDYYFTSEKEAKKFMSELKDEHFKYVPEHYTMELDPHANRQGV